jgi:hypothetical protein
VVQLVKVTIGDPEYTVEVGVGDLVRDDLTRDVVKIVRIEGDGYAVGVWIDHPYLDGGRHPWELTPLRPSDTITP